MKTKLWFFSVVFFLLYVAPVLLIMMWLVLTPTPVVHALYYWLPFALLGTACLTYWYKRQSKAQLRD